MKIIHLNHSDISGGAARSAYRIHHSLLKEGANTEMWVEKAISNDYSIKQPFNYLEKKINKFCNLIIHHSIVKMLKTKNKIIHSPSILPSRWLKYINNSDADIVHLHWIQNEMLSIKDISKIKKPVVWTLHDMWAFCGAEHYTSDNRWINGYHQNNRPNYETGFDLNRWTWHRKKEYWKKPIQVVTSSNWLANCVKKSKIMHNWPVSVIPTPIDIINWKPLDKIVARKKLNLPINVPLILFGADSDLNDRRKGFDLLLSALKNLKKNSYTKKIELVVFGHDKPNYQIHFDFPIHYTGQLNNDVELQTVYSATDLTIVPSRQDNLPNIVIEAQACGSPVVAFDIGGLPDIIQHKKTGYLAKPFNTEDLANGISTILINNKFGEFNKYSTENISLNFNEKKIAQSYLNIYEMILKNK